MFKPLPYIVFLGFLLRASAQADTPEIITILAPKPLMVMKTSEKVIDGNEFAEFSGLNRTIADQLIAIPGVSLNGQGGQFQSYAIRGFSGGRILTEIDGIPIITDRRAGNSASFIAPDLIESVRVIKGPNSALYGSQSLGGVVSLSSQMDNNTQFKVSTQVNNDAVTVSLKQQHGSLGAGIAYQHSNNDTTPDGEVLNTQFERLSGLLRFTQYNENVTTHISWIPSYGKHIGKSNLNFPQVAVSEYPEEFHSLAQIHLQSRSDWSAKLFHHYQNWDSATLERQGMEALTQYQSHTLGAQWLNNVDPNTLIGFDWLARKGVKIDSQYWLSEDHDSHQQVSIANSIYGDEDNLAIYSNSQWQWGTKRINSTIRYDWLKQSTQDSDSVSDAQLNASLSVSVPLTSSLMLVANIANGFRYPTLSERYFNGQTPRGTLKGNQGLVAETSVGSELAFNWQASESVTIYTTLFDYDLDNYIERYRLSDDIFSFRNLPVGVLRGLETQLLWYVNDGLEHQLSYQYQYGDDGLGNPLADVAPKRLSWRAKWQLGDLSLQQSLIHYSSQRDVATSEIGRDSATVWSLSMEYQVNSRQTVSLIIHNVNNQSYYGSLDENAALQPGRNASLVVNWLM